MWVNGYRSFWDRIRGTLLVYLLWFCRSNAFSGFSWLALDLRADWSKNEARVRVSVHQLLSLVEGCPGEHQFPWLSWLAQLEQSRFLWSEKALRHRAEVLVVAI